MKSEVVSDATTGDGWVSVQFVPKPVTDVVPEGISTHEFDGTKDSLLYLRDRRTLLAGLGDQQDSHVFRTASGAAVFFLKRIGITSATLDLAGREDYAAAALEGAILADYQFEQFKPETTPRMVTVQIRVTPERIEDARATTRRAAIVADAANYGRNICNQPGNLLYPETLADEAQRLAKTHNLRTTVLAEKELKAKRFGGILAVGAGSSRSPRLIILTYRGGAKDAPPIALVGKAITFDTGGISLKNRSGMEEMVFDKSGGMAVLGAMAGIAALDLRRNVVGVIASAENMPGGNAYRPGDVVTTYGGTHVEIQNTDAEGRMVLADALTFARTNLNAAILVDLATLTGACAVALGDAAAGLWSTSDALREQLLTASAVTGERLWPMPLYPEYDQAVKSEIAELKNVGGKLAGACTAAAFLKAFTGDTPWAHLDIAATASLEKPRADLGRGATGFGIRTLIELVENVP